MPVRTQLEVERKFTVKEDFETEALQLPSGVRLVEEGHLEFEATYFDTADLRLAAQGISLRRRDGGPDDGWHLKLPYSPDGREEISEPASARQTEPPESLTSLVRVHLRGTPVGPVARVMTRRAVHLLEPEEDEGRVLAELMDDRVTGQSLGEQVTVTTWREVELELSEGDAPLLEAVTSSLQRAGATRATAPSKLESALAERWPRRPGTPQKLGRRSDASAVVLSYVQRQVAALKAVDPAVRRDAEDAVHQMRVASRRLRSALKTFRPHLAGARTDDVRGELRWLGRVLGDARDAEVLHARLRERLDAEPTAPGTAVALARIATTMQARYEQAHAEVLRQLDGDRYLRLIDDLDLMLDDPPLTDRAHRPADQELPRRVRKVWRSVRRLHQAAEAAGTAAERETALHEVRKAAKRARYAAEALRPVVGEDAERFAAAMEHLQEVLGEYRDSHVAQETLSTTAAQAHAAGEDTFVYGLLTAREQARAAAALGAYEAAWREAARKKLHRWTKP